MYLVVAFGSLVAIIIGVMAAIYFQVMMSRPVIETPVPPPYVAQPKAINLDTVRAHLAPPTNIHFVVVYSPIERPLIGQEIVGYFDADTPNGLAHFPNDFDILGGKDASLFERVAIQASPPGAQISTPRAGLKAAPALVDQINKALPGLRAPQQQGFSVRVVARDVYGNLSAPADVPINLVYSPPTAGPSPLPPTEMTDLQRLAREIALTVDPSRTPAYFDAYKRALGIPKECGTNDDDTVFVSSYRQAFDAVRKKLHASNIEAFYAGVCDAWREVIAEQNAASEQANAARNEAMAKNVAAHAQAEMEKLTAAVARNNTVAFVGGAISLFMVISLFLAFLAIENHSKAMRQAIEVIANERRG